MGESDNLTARVNTNTDRLQHTAHTFPCKCSTGKEEEEEEIGEQSGTEHWQTSERRKISRSSQNEQRKTGRPNCRKNMPQQDSSRANQTMQIDTTDRRHFHPTTLPSTEVEAEPKQKQKSRKQEARTCKNSQSIAVQQQQQLSDLTAAKRVLAFTLIGLAEHREKQNKKRKNMHIKWKRRKRKRNTAAVTDQFTTGSDGDANTAPYIQSNSVHKQQRKTTKVVKESKVKSSKVRQREVQVGSCCLVEPRLTFFSATKPKTSRKKRENVTQMYPPTSSSSSKLCRGGGRGEKRTSPRATNCPARLGKQIEEEEGEGEEDDEINELLLHSATIAGQSRSSSHYHYYFCQWKSQQQQQHC